MAFAGSPPVQVAALAGGMERLSDEVSGMRTDMQALVQGLSLMLETQAVHSEMLRQLLEAATQEAPGENPMETLLRQLQVSLDTLTLTVQRHGQKIDNNSQRLAGAIIRGAAAPVEEEFEGS